MKEQKELIQHPDLRLSRGSRAFFRWCVQLSISLPGWTKVGACLLLLLGFFSVVWRWSHRTGWSAMHRLAPAGGGLFTYAWLGIAMEPESGPKMMIDYIGQYCLRIVCDRIVCICCIKIANVSYEQRKTKSGDFQWQM
jgi:hypothetical protein